LNWPAAYPSRLAESHEDLTIVSLQPAAALTSATLYFTCQMLAALAGAALLFVGVSIDPGPLPGPTAAAASAESHRESCVRLAGVVGDNLAARWIDIRSEDLLRKRQVSVQACLNDFTKFDRLKNRM
jgi:hypothetical protein